MIDRTVWRNDVGKFFEVWRSGDSICIGDGWRDIVCDLVDALIERLEPGKWHLLQIKEKFGTLRFYYQLDNAVGEETAQIVDKLVQVAEGKSSETCETCGKPGSERDNHRWIKTLCDVCHEQRERLCRICNKPNLRIGCTCLRKVCDECAKEYQHVCSAVEDGLDGVNA